MLLASCSLEDPDPVDAVASGVHGADLAVPGCQQQAGGDRRHDELLVAGKTAAAAHQDTPACAAGSVNPTGLPSPGGEAAVPNWEYRIG